MTKSPDIAGNARHNAALLKMKKLFVRIRKKMIFDLRIVIVVLNANSLNWDFWDD